MFQIECIVNSLFSSNTYILRDVFSQNIWVIDCGDCLKIKSKLSENKKIIGVLLTHSHFDHIYGLPSLLETYPECKIITNQYGKEALGDDKLNMSRYHDNSIIVKSDNIICSKDGDEIELFDNVVFRIYETPGHNPSCLTYLCDDYIFTGDSYIPGIKVVTNLPKGNKVLAQESLNKIQTLIGNRTICPGHVEMVKADSLIKCPNHHYEIKPYEE